MFTRNSIILILIFTVMTFIAMVILFKSLKKLKISTSSNGVRCAVAFVFSFTAVIGYVHWGAWPAVQHYWKVEHVIQSLHDFLSEDHHSNDPTALYYLKTLEEEIRHVD